MGELATKFGGKRPGDLIRTEDWNGLINGIELMEAALGQRIGALKADLETRIGQVEQRLGGLETKIGTLEAGVNSLKGTVDFLLGRLRQVSLRTTRTSYAVGELAEITARVADARGNPLNLTQAASRPWIDFVCTWGQLLSAGGSETLSGAGGRTLSVQVDERGEARVLLRSELAEGLADDFDRHVTTSLSTSLPTNNDKSLRDTILDSKTPMEANLRGAFQVMSLEYDRADGMNFRSYVDTHFIRNPPRIAANVPPVFTETWRDHHSTVLAFVKGDSDPNTAEPGQGVCSIQVTFRDWISPWIFLDYFDPTKTKVEAGDLVTHFNQNVGKDFSQTTRNFNDSVEEDVKDKGLIGRYRYYQAASLALDSLSSPETPEFVAEAARSTRNGILLQQTLEPSEANFGIPAQRAGLQAVTGIALQADAGAAAAKEEAGLVRSEQQQLRDDLNREDGPIALLSKRVNNFDTQISELNLSVANKAERTFVTGLFNLNQ